MPWLPSVHPFHYLLEHPGYSSNKLIHCSWNGSELQILKEVEKVAELLFDFGISSLCFYKATVKCVSANFVLEIRKKITWNASMKILWKLGILCVFMCAAFVSRCHTVFCSQKLLISRSEWRIWLENFPAKNVTLFKLENATAECMTELNTPLKKTIHPVPKWHFRTESYCLI